jgi:predicted enzyme related to lactoylglutathione lyase
MKPPPDNPVVHLELHTGNLPDACAFYHGLLGWQPEKLSCSSGSYLALGLGNGIDGGVVECASPRPLWLPYVQVADAATVTEAAREMGARILLEPREGPVGWRSVIAGRTGGEIGLWQPKPRT